MTKRPLCMVVIGFLFGTLGILYPGASTFYLVSCMIISAVAVILHLKDGSYSRGIITFIGILSMYMAGHFFTLNSETRRQAISDYLTFNQVVTAQGRLYQKELTDEKIILYLDNAYISTSTLQKCQGIQVYIDAGSTNNDGLILGNIFVIYGKYTPYKVARNPGNYDEEKYYQNLGIDFRISDAKIISVHGKSCTFREQLFMLRTRLEKVIFKNMSDDKAGILSAMILGDKKAVDSQSKTLYQNSGIAHMLSVSGMHVSLLCMGLFYVLRKALRRLLRQLTPMISALLSLTFSIVYCIFTGSSISTTRAVGMFGILLVANTLGESYDSITSAFAMILILMLNNPRCILAAGFQLSFSAVFCVALLYKRLTQIQRLISKRLRLENIGRYNQLLSEERRRPSEVLRRSFGQLASRLTASLLLSYSIAIGTLPLIVFYYYEIPIYVMLVNVLLLPLMGFLLVIGLVGATLGLCTLAPLSVFSRVLLQICQIVLSIYDLIAQASLRLPSSQLIIGQPSVAGIIAYYLLLTVLLYFLTQLIKFSHRTRDTRKAINTLRMQISADSSYSLLRKSTLKKNLLMAGTMVGIYMCLLGELYLSVTKCPEIVMLDVGQGDGLFIRSKRGEYFFVDGGSTSSKSVGKYQILPFLKSQGVNHIDYWFVSHPDEDHVSGLIDLLESDFDIRNIVFAQSISSNENYEKICSMLTVRNTKALYLSPYDKIASDNVCFTCLFPYSDYQADDTNSQSLVLLLNVQNTRMLLTGDIGAPEEEALLQSADIEDLKNIEFLKVAHHGSKNSSSEAFVEFTCPKYALISVASRNRYGHPHENTLNILEANGANIYRTDTDGAIIISFSSKEPSIKRWISSK